ncbi:hypothetical protein O181_032321 [Austropuccinia psidii MF-1]|uniref:Uncharacterized protein n=1 Tax=Austropuccinia psidii MF-1 TaxID=1389203 RepID=A0A9Q3D274_9BASI|nr:hypothetical protein [Austropuccinia psidii MF-1]
MAFLGPLGPLRLLWPVGPLGPFWLNPMRPKGAKGGSPLNPKPQVGPPEPVFDHGPKSTNFGQPKGPPVAHFQTWPLVAPRGHQLSSNPLFPSTQGEDFPLLKDAGVGYIWYYMPLCTIFVQQSNGDIFRTQLHYSKSRSQNPSPILKEDSSAHQSGNS